LGPEQRAYRLVFLALGMTLLLMAPVVSSWVPFYYSSAMTLGVLLVVLVLLYQVFIILSFTNLQPPDAVVGDTVNGSALFQYMGFGISISLPLELEMEICVCCNMKMIYDHHFPSFPVEYIFWSPSPSILVKSLL
jgi:hypothetical protein